MRVVRERLRAGTLEPSRQAKLIDALKAAVEPIITRFPPSDIYFDAMVLAVTWKDTRALDYLRESASKPGYEPRRLQVFATLIEDKDDSLPELVTKGLAEKGTESFKRSLLAALGGWDDPRVGGIVLDAYPKLDAPLQPVAVELLTQRPAWTLAMLDAIAAKQLPREALNLNQVRKLAGSGDKEVVKRIETIWGRVRTDRNPDRENVINRTREMLGKAPGDTGRGKEIFARVCGQCHVLHGQGQLIGPDLTGSGRGSFEQLLSNVLDPNLVVGEAYQLRTVTMKDGRVLAGMTTEDNDQRIVLKILGGQSETLPREQVAKVETLPLSFMPEGLEASMTPQELADLFAYLMAD